MDDTKYLVHCPGSDGPGNKLGDYRHCQMCHKAFIDIGGPIPTHAMLDILRMIDDGVLVDPE